MTLLSFLIHYGPIRLILTTGLIHNFAMWLLQVVDGYFVHFVAPENLPPMPRHLVFALDISGSMLGKKIKQTKDAMKTILKELRVGDFITIINFADNVTTWDHDGNVVVPVTEENVKSALDHVAGLVPKGLLHLGRMIPMLKTYAPRLTLLQYFSFEIRRHF